MRTPYTERGQRSAYAIIIVELEPEIRNTPKVLELDTEDQQIIFEPLRNEYPPPTLREVFLRLKNNVEPKYVREGRAIQIREGELDLSLLADYIGYLRGCWADPRLKEVSYEDTRYGVVIKLPRGTAYLRINTNVQRYIHNKSMEDLSLQQIIYNLRCMHSLQGLPVTAYGENTISRLSFLIIEKLRDHPAWQGSHWHKVGLPFGINEPITVGDEYIFEAQAPPNHSTSSTGPILKLVIQTPKPWTVWAGSVLSRTSRGRQIRRGPNIMTGRCDKTRMISADTLEQGRFLKT